MPEATAFAARLQANTLFWRALEKIPKDVDHLRAEALDWLSASLGMTTTTAYSGERSRMSRATGMPRHSRRNHIPP